MPPFLTGPHLELDLAAFAQILEVDFWRQLRAMEKNFLAAVVGSDEPEAFVLDNLFYCAKHLINLIAGLFFPRTFRPARFK